MVEIVPLWRCLIISHNDSIFQTGFFSSSWCPVFRPATSMDRPRQASADVFYCTGLFLLYIGSTMGIKHF